ncbi:MAG: DUF370 domain-containing protein [Desulfobacterales bacterium]|nr:DUF370 domain-containing protein [Desulfobacterales bacterium]
MTVNNLLVNIGFGNVVAVSRIVAVVSSGSRPGQEDEGRSPGTGAKSSTALERSRKTRSILITDSDHIILSALQAGTLVQEDGRTGSGGSPWRRLRTRGTLFVVSAPSGAGKATLCRRICRASSGNRVVRVAHDEKSQAGRGKDGVDYVFTDSAAFPS